MPPRRRSTRTPHTVWSFLGEFLVACPSCAKRAVARAPVEARPPRLTCARCGLSRDWVPTATGVLFSRPAARWPQGQFALGDAADPYFHLPLWLQVPCAGNVLWAFNARHLAFLRDYVSATDRRTLREDPRAPRNRLLTSRLPRWMKLARNRVAVLRGIGRLEKKLTAEGA
jgi:hypothetical protein